MDGTGHVYLALGAIDHGIPHITPGAFQTTRTGVAGAVVKAIEHNKVEVAVAPLMQRTLAHVGLATPGLSLKIQSGSAGQKAAAAVAKGQTDKH